MESSPLHAHQLMQETNQSSAHLASLLCSHIAICFLNILSLILHCSAVAITRRPFRSACSSATLQLFQPACVPTLSDGIMLQANCWRGLRSSNLRPCLQSLHCCILHVDKGSTKVYLSFAVLWAFPCKNLIELFVSLFAHPASFFV